MQSNTTTAIAETTQPDVRFPLGRTFITRGALEARDPGLRHDYEVCRENLQRVR